MEENKTSVSPNQVRRVPPPPPRVNPAQVRPVGTQGVVMPAQEKKTVSENTTDQTQLSAGVTPAQPKIAQGVVAPQKTESKQEKFVAKKSSKVDGKTVAYYIGIFASLGVIAVMLFLILK